MQGKIALLKMQLTDVKNNLSFTRNVLEDLADDMDLECSMLDNDSGSGSDEIDEFWLL